MFWNWQNLAAIGCVLLAVAYLARAARRVMSARKGSCGACSSCPTEKTPSGKQLVTLGGITPPKSRPL